MKIAVGMDEAEELGREMAGMRVKVTGAGGEQYWAWRSGEHDDLALAVALACWGGRQCYPNDGPGWLAREEAAARQSKGAGETTR